MTYQIESLKKLAKLEIGMGDRLVRIIAKKGQIGTIKTESLGCVIPNVSVSMLNTLVNDEIGREYLCNAVASVQDGIIRRLVESGKVAIFDGQFDISSIINAMQTANESQRFSKEAIKVWFDEHLRPVLDDKVSEKFPNVSSEQQTKMVNGYLDSFQILAQRQPSMDNKIKAALLRVMDYLPEDHDHHVATEIANRLASVQEASALLAAL